MDLVRRVVGAHTLPAWAWATLTVQSLIIVTGTTVRLTGSGLGCPTWPRCTADSFVPQGELTIHAAIEFGNRLLTFLLIAVALATFAAALAAWSRDRTRRSSLVLAIVIGLGVPLQAVVGGITVRTQLNPFIVAPHLLISVAMVVLSTWLVRAATRRPGHRAAQGGRLLTLLIFCSLMISIWLGTIVTGSGPHAGDAGALRTGFDIETVAKLHAGSVWVLLGLTVVAVAVLRTRAAVGLLLVLLAQGAIGYLQYFTGLPVPVVALHMIGIPACTIAGTWLLLDSRTSAAAASPAAQIHRVPS